MQLGVVLLNLLDTFQECSASSLSLFLFLCPLSLSLSAPPPLLSSPLLSPCRHADAGAGVYTLHGTSADITAVQNGWLSPFRINCISGSPDVLLSSSVGAIDFAGSGNVHMTGGGAALIGAIIIQARRGRFSEYGHQLNMTAHNPALQVLGTLILWMGW